MRRLTHHLYFWVLLAIISGGLFGYLDPGRAVKLKPLGDGFIALVKMLISPVIFCTVVLGINGAGDMKKVGRVGGKALLYFEVISTFALIIGLTVVNVVRPGAGFNVQPGTLDANAVADYAKRAASSEHRRLHSPRHSDDIFRCIHRLRGSAAGPVRRHSLRLCHDAHGRQRKDCSSIHRGMLPYFLRNDEHAYETCAFRSGRRHGVHHRPVRCRGACGRWRC